MFATTLVSAFIHEYLLALALRFASPVLLLEFAGLGGKDTISQDVSMFCTLDFFFAARKWCEIEGVNLVAIVSVYA